MRAYVPGYELLALKSLPEVLDLLAREPGKWRPLAGGTDLMVLFAAGQLPYRHLVSIWGVAELRGIAVEPAAVTLGSLTTYADILWHPIGRARISFAGCGGCRNGWHRHPEPRHAGWQ